VYREVLTVGSMALGLGERQVSIEVQMCCPQRDSRPRQDGRTMSGCLEKRKPTKLKVWSVFDAVEKRSGRR